jgi:hypothetical protein
MGHAWTEHERNVAQEIINHLIAVKRQKEALSEAIDTGTATRH